ncbi:MULTISPECIES: hypothetical protein [unclassified Okeania]|uniref:hypothetical protein n=1 Tax=unclassified Okeania TaxID=2634635 RepID=UPI0013B8D204|nr:MULTISPECIES: hypothetical protein [unclassified Okeania]NET22629.1 hypothetical protein [Okeania sp. SIO1H5]NET95780.1 hypothetical protein [Okeania sp. SIO1H2]
MGKPATPQKRVVVHSNGRESVGRWGPTPRPSPSGRECMGEIKKYISSPKPIQDYPKKNCGEINY